MSRRTETCLTCQHYNRCKDPNKAFGYHCASYKTVAGTSASVLLDLIAEDTLTGGDSLPHANDMLMSDKRAKKKESELIDYLDEVLTNPNPIPRDLKFDDSDLPEFKNFFHWANAKNGANTPPFARQLAIGIHLFAEYCPRCSNERFSNIYTVPYRASMDKIADNVTFLEYGKCPKCKVTKSELINRGELNLYDEFAGAIGQRGGKSAMFSLLAPYILHKYLKLQNPNRLYGQMEHTVLSGTFVGLTFARAMSLLWTPILNLIRTSDWFVEYHKLLDYYGNKYDVVPYVIKDTFVEYRHRRLRLYPSGPNKRTLRGDTRFMSGIDEAGWFYSGDDDDEERERASGKEVHGALDRSLKTIRTASSAKIRDGYDNLVCGYNISISSPSHNKDLIMYLTGLYENSSECLAIRLPTWKFNPLYKGRDDFKKEYAENYARAERDFGVNPQVNENKAYSQDEVFAITQQCRGQNMVEITTEAISVSDKAYTKPKIMRLVGNDVPSVLSMDAGETNNSFSLTLVQRQDEKAQPQVAAVIEIMPIKGTSINFNRVYEELLVPILTVFNVCGVITDRWQSKAILTRIADEFGIYVKELSAKPSHFTVFESYMRPDVLVTFPKLEMTVQDLFGLEGDYRKKFAKKPVAHLMHQFNTIQELGGIYEKGVDNTDDSLRALVLGINLIMDIAFVSKYLKVKPRQVTQAVGAVTSMGFMGGGGITYDPTQASHIGASSASASQAPTDFGSLIASRGSRR